jgi:hypothetical protein
VTWMPQLDVGSRPEEARRVREWVAEQFAAPAARQVAGELFVTLAKTSSWQIAFTIAEPHNGWVRITARGTRHLPLSAQIGHSWNVLHALARVGVTVDWFGVEAEIPVRIAARASTAGEGEQ